VELGNLTTQPLIKSIDNLEYTCIIIVSKKGGVMKWSQKLLGMIFLLLFVAGCATVNLETKAAEDNISMSHVVNKNYKKITHFKRNTQAWFAIFDLATISNPNLRNIVEDEIRAVDGDGVVNLQIKGETTFIDGCISILTGSLIRPRSYTIEGDVVKYIAK